ncbi:MAG: hypothetical protein DKM50_02315 [Candidatus Margulisiibacteriota bacterium]|nr:MAG: hypothetical protein A2X43_06770 [Candidatus Margulisbacteria bacterium GWD2_39_127]OGI05279.1 MAG: hypothetical protein A2X42_03715 [Candidatus Margulisbacteria bacterium GWF2_38_17]OGI10862.1 MAG: hypothetical protein A2X41_05760 [Candidatus Margulisbacteria bacterium GWE2_39_32]PZM83550.1 MAG: hypothetical protein DKM50_02315 [Candidatus Margulisiibacteriota bacterium]HAR64272.1 hypothetical protein [Candidatus Margulisiibacteriota bacterium]
MSILFDISMRNLFRQKRRNVLLGIAIAFGMMILVIANSFSHGISDSLLNRVIVYVAGHMEIATLEEGKMRFPIMRDKDRFLKIINENVKDIKRIEESLSIFTKAIGNGKSDNVVLVGVNPDKEFYGFFKAISGKSTDFMDESIRNPVIISAEKAKSLNVKLHDVLRVRLQNVYGQQQTDVLTIVAVVKSENMFMDMAIYLSRKNLKQLVGLKPYETGSLQIILNNPKIAIEQANSLYKKLTPGVAAIYGELKYKDTSVPATTLAFYRNDASLAVITKNIVFVSGDVKEALGKEGVILSGKLAASLKLSVGDTFDSVYKNKYEGGYTTNNYTVKAIYTVLPTILPDNVLLLSDKLFYKTYYRNLPPDASNEVYQPPTSNLVYAALGKEWNLLKRTSNSDEYMKKMKSIIEDKSAVAVMDVRTMYETASSVLQMEKVLNLITLTAVMVLFFIILIGVVNTLRMTIRERTREIGTLRAIGMQKPDVRNSFIVETLLLTFMASIVGIVAAFIVMGLTHFITFNTVTALNILLVNKHLHFVPSVFGILFNMLLILVIAGLTSYFPARRAASLSAAHALRHFE